ncbi:hypothetical protein F53441_842 [Fusarium austroafricanum]|uniref:Uncharacterized protein n=1 Tax=Fusarium austroafricanum TaxID=2364996 RepID=A0A8H4NZN7_9HYPO|nr:hypothetical protein F53441_842 [Fusarium austroafricanum]
MIRQKWLPNARVILTAQNRAISCRNASFSSFSGDDKSMPGPDQKLDAPSNRDSNAVPKPNWMLESTAPCQKDGHSMLVIKGLPTTLRAADFNRLIAGKLTSWGNTITQVTQERDPWTMEPLGNYFITFASSIALRLYRDKLMRDLRLAQSKMEDKTGLWASKLDSVLVDGKTSPEAELERFTLLPGSYSHFPIAESKRARKMAWTNVMERIIGHSSMEAGSSVVMIELPQANFSASELKAIINQDGVDSGHRWGVDVVFNLYGTTRFERRIFQKTSRMPIHHENADARHKLNSRYIVVCKNPESAWRFIRSWNQRILEYDGGDGVIHRNRVKVSYIDM